MLLSRSTTSMASGLLWKIRLAMRICVSARWRSLTSRTLPVKPRWPLTTISRTASSIGKVLPSLRRPTTSRPGPITRASPVAMKWCR